MGQAGRVHVKGRSQFRTGQAGRFFFVDSSYISCLSVRWLHDCANADNVVKYSLSKLP